MTYHSTKISDTRRVRWVIDEEYDFSMTFESITGIEEKDYKEQQAKLESGALIALDAIAETKCKSCNEWHEVDSLWGIVTEPDTNTLDALAPEMVNFPDEQPDVFRIMQHPQCRKGETMTDALQNALGLLATGPVSALYREQGETSYYNRTVRELKAAIDAAPQLLEALEACAKVLRSEARAQAPHMGAMNPDLMDPLLNAERAIRTAKGKA